jgi:carbamate kinase
MQSPTVVAIGGHSLLDPDLEPTVANQFAVTAAAMVPVADLLERGERLVLTHGNGPQVGFLQLRSEMARMALPEVPLDSLVADTQGAMGYMIERAPRAELRRRGLEHEVITVVTEVEVDHDDPAFDAPDKPIGPFYERAEAERLAELHGWQLTEDPRRGFRLVVASPQPRRIVQLPTIRKLVELDVTVICCGGGGIPVSREPDWRIRGEEAVIDKDRVSMQLAVLLGAARFVITTSVDHVYEGWLTDSPTPRPRLTVAEVRAMAAAGEFPPGSMAPKMEAVVGYLEAVDGQAIICLPGDLVDAIDGRAGTHIRREVEGGPDP